MENANHSTASGRRPSSAQTTFISASFALQNWPMQLWEKKRCQGGQLVAIMSEHWLITCTLNMLKQTSTLKQATCRQATLQVPAAVPRPNKSALIRRQGRNFPLRSWPSTSKCYHPNLEKKNGSLTHLLPTFLAVPCFWGPSKTLLEAMRLATKIRSSKRKTQRIYAKDFICKCFPAFFGPQMIFFFSGWGFSNKNPPWRKNMG